MSDLIQRFKSEVLDAGPESTLPCNLTEEWLDVLAKQADSLLEEEENARITELLAAVLHILFAKNGFKDVQAEESELFEYLQQYRLELALEDISRRTDMHSNAATIDSIFTDRAVEFQRLQSGA